MSPADAVRDRLLSVVWTAQAIAAIGRAREALLRLDHPIVSGPVFATYTRTTHLRQRRRAAALGPVRLSVARGLIRVSSRSRSPI